MNSPQFYMLATLALTSAMFCVVFYLAWKTQVPKPHALTWSIASFIGSLHWLAALGMPIFPDFASYWLTFNALALVSIVLLVHGHRQRTNATYIPRMLLAIPVVAVALIAWFTSGAPHVGLRTAILPAFFALAMMLSAVMILRHRRKPRPAEWATATIMILFGVSQVGAAIAALMQGAAGNAVYLAVMQNINLIVLPVGLSGLGLCTIYMLTSDLSEEMKEIAVRDQLTGLYNRRGFGEQASNAYSHARQTGRMVSVIMSDIDRFKYINDELGHAAGDDALCHFADILREGRNDSDILARMGGEEFALVLPETSLGESMQIAKDLCQRLESSPLKIESRSVKMTASFGVASISDRDTCLTDVIIRADRALYRSKRAGRNRVDLESSQMMRTLDSIGRETA